MPLSDQVTDYFLQLPDSELEDAAAIRVTVGDEVFDFEITEEMLGQRERWKDANRELRQVRLDADLARQEFVRQTLPLLCMLVAIWAGCAVMLCLFDSPAPIYFSLGASVIGGLACTDVFIREEDR